MSQTTFTRLLKLTYDPPHEIVRYGQDEFQFVEYWRPTSENAPLVILVHGGCWLNAYKTDHIRPLASRLFSEGYGVWSIEYRRVGDQGGGWPGSFQDIIEATNAVRHLDNIDQERIFLMGHSAGGHLALWLAAANGFNENSPFFDKLRIKVKGVVGLAAISNLVDYAKGSSSCEKATQQLIGGMPETHEDRYRYASPHWLKTDTNTILIHGSIDNIVAIRQSETFATSSDKVRLVSMQGLGHFDLINPNNRAFDKILQALRGFRP